MTRGAKVPGGVVAVMLAALTTPARGARYSRRRLEEWLRDPAAQRPTAHMPRIRLKGGEITALVAYLAALR